MKKLLLSIIAFLTICSFATSAPADKSMFMLKQPDGTTIRAYIYGDENHHYYTTDDGFTIKQDKDGYYRYVTGYENAKPLLSKITVKNQEERNQNENMILSNINTKDIVMREYMISQARKIKKQSLKSINRIQAFPNSGKVNGLVILVEFEDKQFQEGNTRQTFDDMLNQENYQSGKSSGSAYDYFTAQSHGQFEPHFDVYGPVKLNKSYSEYGQNNLDGNDIAAHAMVKEACEALDNDIDFSKYDLNNDGTVDLIFALYAGYGENGGAGAETIWPHASDLTYYYSEPIKLDGKILGPYACSCELRGNQNMSEISTAGIGVFCHEFSHCLGLYDLYDTDGALGGTGRGFGSYSIMDNGCYNNDGYTPCSYTAFERMMIGWLTPKELDDTYSELSLQDLNQQNDAFIMYNPSDKNEYFMFENRQQTGWDKFLPGHGMLISHINYNEEKWTSNLVNNEYENEGAVIVPANNIYASSTEANQLYPYKNNNSFTDISTPSAIFNDGTKAGKPLTNIREENGIIYFTYLDVVLSKPVALEATDINGEGFTANWEKVDHAQTYTLKITPVGENQHPGALLYEDFSLFTSGSMESASNSDISSKLDQYMNTPGWRGSKVYQAGGVCKLATSTAQGYLVSPEIDMPESFTISVDAKDYATSSGKLDKTTLYIGIGEKTENGEGGEWMEYKEFSLTDKMNNYSLTCNQGGKPLCFEIGTLNKRAFIDNIVVQDNSKSMSPMTESPITIEDITECKYRVTGLNPDYKYSYTVTAHAGDKVSEESNIIYVTTTSSVENTYQDNTKVYTANGKLYIESAENANVIIYNIDGTCLYSTDIENTASIELTKGIYIICINSKSYKVII